MDFDMWNFFFLHHQSEYHYKACSVFFEPMTAMAYNSSSKEMAKKHPRILCKENAVEIYQQKIDILSMFNSKNTHRVAIDLVDPLKGRSLDISFSFGVSPKTVRDIWNRRTWQYATCHLWSTDDAFCMLNSQTSRRIQFHQVRHLKV